MKLFHDFGNVDVRNERITQQSDLEKLLKIEDEILALHPSSTKRYSAFQCNILYTTILKKTEELLQGINLTNNLLQEYISNRENHGENDDAVVRGMYSGALLQILSKNKEEVIQIIGSEKKFDYLFYYVKETKNVIVKNVIGNNLFCHAGSYGGKISHIYVTNIKGINTLGFIGNEKGRAEHIVAVDITGSFSFCELGSLGYAKNITAINCRGDFSFFRAGRIGEIHNLTISNAKGNNILSTMADTQGKCSGLIASQIEGNDTLEMAGTQKGTIENVTLAEIEGKDLLVAANIKGYRMHKRLPSRKQDILDEIERSVKEMFDKNAQYQMSESLKIAQLQEELFVEET